MVYRRKGQFRPADWPPHFSQTVKGLGRGYFVNQMSVDEEQRSATRNISDGMGCPNFVEQCRCHNRYSILLSQRKQG